MTEPRRAAVLAIDESLRSILDPIMERHQFGRLRRKRGYSRACKDGEQHLFIHIEWRPIGNRAAICRLFPHIKVIFPAVNRIALELVGNDEMLIGDPECTISQPIDIFIPVDQQVRWYMIGSQDAKPSIRSIANCINDWVFPFFDEVVSVDALTMAYETRDRRFEWPRTFLVYIVAAYILLGLPALGKKVLNEQFGRPATRKRYARAFEFIDTLQFGRADK